MPQTLLQKKEKKEQEEEKEETYLDLSICFIR